MRTNNKTVSNRNTVRKNNNNYYNIKKSKIYFMSLILTIMLVLIIVLSNSLKTNATENRDRSNRIYTSILIEEGDTLWSIAQEYKPADVSTQDYIDTLKSINVMKSDNIHSGNYLMIYYYKD